MILHTNLDLTVFADFLSKFYDFLHFSRFLSANFSILCKFADKITKKQKNCQSQLRSGGHVHISNVSYYMPPTYSPCLSKNLTFCAIANVPKLFKSSFPHYLKDHRKEQEGPISQIKNERQQRQRHHYDLRIIINVSLV